MHYFLAQQMQEGTWEMYVHARLDLPSLNHESRVEKYSREGNAHFPLLLVGAVLLSNMTVMHAVEFNYGNGWTTGDIYDQYPWGNSAAILIWQTWRSSAAIRMSIPSTPLEK
jgi:hypothetical protein